ncbi:hypothetical protein KSD_55910 [Ktedonobacter sp. SOSP1-85]|nr:hypothetical protein [Ktedonobacter sp. SOSP1-85]GHO77820.1 hypothetical protein KSD_55910 [Ktedonobacter sp. SOSP1-85]
MRADPAWHAARALPRSHKAERATAFSALRKAYGFTEAALHEAVKGLFTRSLSMHFPCALTRNEKVRTNEHFVTSGIIEIDPI